MEPVTITERSLPAGPLLAVHAHPDDETLATGGLLATWAAAGQPVTLVTCTRGERGEVIGSELAHLEGDGPALAAHREEELDAALAALGVQSHYFLDQLVGGRGGSSSQGLRYEDSGMAWVGAAGGQAGAAEDVPAGALVAVPLDEAAAGLAELIRELRPAVVVTYEPGGGYGHPDHVRAHAITQRALELAAQPSPAHPAHVPDVWWAVIPADLVRSSRAALHAASRTDADLAALLASSPTATLPDAAPDAALPAAATSGRSVVATIDVRPVLDKVEAALAAHATQVHWAQRAQWAQWATDGEGLAGWYALSNDVLVPWLTHEHYASGMPASGMPQ